MASGEMAVEVRRWRRRLESPGSSVRRGGECMNLNGDRCESQDGSRAKDQQPINHIMSSRMKNEKVRRGNLDDWDGTRWPSCPFHT